MRSPSTMQWNRDLSSHPHVSTHDSTIIAYVAGIHTMIELTEMTELQLILNNWT